MIGIPEPILDRLTGVFRQKCEPEGVGKLTAETLLESPLHARIERVEPLQRERLG
jgi:hypothetical protein